MLFFIYYNDNGLSEEWLNTGVNFAYCSMKLHNVACKKNHCCHCWCTDDASVKTFCLVQIAHFFYDYHLMVKKHLRRAIIQSVSPPPCFQQLVSQTCRPQTHFLFCKYHLSYMITRIDHLPGRSARPGSWTNVHTQTSNWQNTHRCALFFCH